MKWEVKWSPTLKCFVLQGEEEVHALELVGRIKAAGSDLTKMHLFVEGCVSTPENGACALSYEGEDPEVPEGAEFLGDNEWVICARLPKPANKNRPAIEPAWRLREGIHIPKATYWLNIEGVYNIDWHDFKGHLIHVGPAYKLNDTTVLLVPRKENG